MNKFVTIIFIALVTIATIGLMMIQVYWIRDAVQLKQAIFAKDVKNAMSKVIYNINRTQLEERINKQKKFYEEHQNTFRVYDSLSKVMYYNFKMINSQSDIDKFVQNSNIANKILSDLSFNYNDQEPGTFYYSKRDLINTFIKHALKEKGITTKFEFGVYSPATNSMILQKSGKYQPELLNESYVFDLSPLGSLFSRPNKLLIFFPNQKRFIIGKLWSMLSVSVVLFLVIIISFSFSIYTIFRQKRLSEMKNDFINNMTHEFKTPISTIALACEALKDSDIQKTESLYDNYLGIINEENGRLGLMAEQILQTAIIDKGQLKLNKSMCNIHDIIVTAAGSKKMALDAKQGAISLQLNANNYNLLGDSAHLTNVILNLLDNAIKYCISKPEITISTQDNGKFLKILIQDNGIGISSSNKNKIFDKLYRVPTGNVHNFKGFGLGLSYVKAIVDEHDGTVSVDSELGKGSTFIVKLPITVT